MHFFDMLLQDTFVLKSVVTLGTLIYNYFLRLLYFLCTFLFTFYIYYTFVFLVIFLFSTSIVAAITLSLTFIRWFSFLSLDISCRALLCSFSNTLTAFKCSDSSRFVVWVLFSICVLLICLRCSFSLFNVTISSLASFRSSSTSMCFSGLVGAFSVRCY